MFICKMQEEEQIEETGYSLLCRPRESCIGRHESVESIFWRKKRASGEINGAFANDFSKISGPASRKAVQKLIFYEGNLCWKDYAASKQCVAEIS
jgi:hypothetical protein